MTADETPTDRKVPFSLMHPPPHHHDHSGYLVQEGSWVTTDDLPGVWKVEGFFGDFARLTAPHRIQARRRHRLRTTLEPDRIVERMCRC